MTNRRGAGATNPRESIGGQYTEDTSRPPRRERFPPPECQLPPPPAPAQRRKDKGKALVVEDFGNAGGNPPVLPTSASHMGLAAPESDPAILALHA